MNKVFRWGFVIVAVVIAATALWPGGVAQAISDPDSSAAYQQTGAWQMGIDQDRMHRDVSRTVYTDTMPYGSYGHGRGFGMMDSGFGMMGMMGSGFGSDSCPMQGGITSPSLYGVEPLTLEEVEVAVEDYLIGLGYDDLILDEVMIFDNHAYAQVVEESTGIGALEVLVDPVTMAVLPEPGPNMMWNTEYGHMSNFGNSGMMGMMQGFSMQQAAAEMSVSPEEAVETAQRYLDRYLPGADADEEADAFYGYYTIHILRDGETVGMLSVNGTTRQVFLHTWHGDLIEMSGESHG